MVSWKPGQIAMTSRPPMDGHGHGVLAGFERRLERPHDLQVRLEIGQLPLPLERLEQAGEVAGG